MILILIGPPGSGKGTQSEMLASQLGLFHFSTGEVFRQIKDPEILSYMKRGDLVPDEKVMQVFQRYIEKEKLFDDLLIDGSPRSLYQFRQFKNIFEKHGKKIDYVVYLKISDKEVIRRLTARREDKKSGKIYNLITNPPGPEVNPNDLVVRQDDNKEAVEKRLKVQKVPQDMLAEIKKDGILLEVDGEKSIDDINQNIKSLLKYVKK